MENGAPPGAKIDRRIEADPISINGQSIQPVARLVGWASTGDGQHSPFAGRVGRLMPLEVRINDGEGERIIPFDDPLQEPLRGIFGVAAAVSTVCILIMLVAKIVTIRQ